MKNNVFTIATIVMFVTFIEFINDASVEHAMHFSIACIIAFALGFRKGSPLRDNLFTEE